MPAEFVGHAGSRRRQRTTISDVALSLNLAKGTVSRALNGYSDISERTKRRVRRKADEMGYVPLCHAQAIRTGFAKSLGLVLVVNRQDSHRPFLAGFLAGVTRATAAKGWTLTVTTTETEAAALTTLKRLITEHKVDGFILPRTCDEDLRVDFLRQENIPFVLFGRNPDPAGCAWYDIEGERAMEDAVLRLHDFGHSRIAFINGGSHYHYSKLRYAGYLSGLEKAGLAFDETLVRTNAITSRHGEIASDALLVHENPPTAFLFAIDRAAFGIYRTAARYGLRIGSDISVISYDGMPEAAYTNPPLTTFSVDRQRAGEQLATILMSHINGVPAEELRILERATLVVRQSDGQQTMTSEHLAGHMDGMAGNHSSAKE
ncbi:MAG: substrate-binding domain-containing protein [Rhodobacteraceae bacterium]|nr:substrate-binding domain-containing protein [Paracoccaceae bacterium]